MSDTQRKIELETCPFCGGEAGYAMCNGGRKHVIYCTEDECYISLVDYIAVDIKKAWNARALQSKPVDVEGLKRNIHTHFHPLHSYLGSTVITIDKMIDYLHAKGYLNTRPQE